MQHQSRKLVCMRAWTRLLVSLAAITCMVWPGLVSPIRATTLAQLTLDDMIQKSPAIVRARVTGSHSAYRGADIYTFYLLQVLESWKASGRVTTDVAIPGGVVN